MALPIIHCLIPARKGSKGIPKKNIIPYLEKPLIAHSILLSKSISSISRTVVSTDCSNIKDIAIKYGAEVPFIRPSCISGDLSPDIYTFKHYLNWLKDNKQKLPDYIIHLRPTYPNRSKELLIDCLKTFINSKFNYTSLRTVVPIDKSMFKMYLVESRFNNPVLIPNKKEIKGITEPYNQVRQILPTTYLHNGCIDIICRETIMNNSMTGNKIYPYIMKKDEISDIDSLQDFKLSKLKSYFNELEKLLKLDENKKKLNFIKNQLL